MNSTKVFTTDGTSMPRRWANHTASGSIDAATSEAASILRGVAGRIIDATRMATVVHDRCIASIDGIAVDVLSVAMPTAFSTRYSRPASVLVCALCGAYRTYRNIAADVAIPRIAMTMWSAGSAAATVYGWTIVSMTRPYIHSPAPAAAHTPTRRTRSVIRSSGSRP